MSEVAVASYLSCAIVYALVTLYLFAHSPTRTQFPILIFSCFLTSLWGVIATLNELKIIYSYPLVPLSEIISDAIWFGCLIQLMRMTQQLNKHRGFCYAASCIAGALFLAGFLAVGLHSKNQWLINDFNPSTPYFFVGYMAFAMLMLALVEQIYRGTEPQRRWQIKFLCLGLGVVYCYEFYMYSNAALSSQMSLSLWQVRGAIFAIVAPLIVLSAQRHHKWRAQIYPSRSVIFRSTILICCAMYLFVTASLSNAIKEWGGLWGEELQVIFYTGALIALSLVLSSSRIRAWVKVFVSKNFFKLRYDYRDEWMRFSMLLFADNSREISKKVIKALADMVESPKGILFEWEENRGYVFKDCWNHAFPSKDMVIEASAFTEYLQKTQRALELPPRFIQDNQNLISIPDEIRQYSWAWMLVPLLHGEKLQAFVLLAHPRVAFFNVNWEVLDLLSMAGRQALICLVQEQNAQALAIARQFEGYNRLSAFVMHDLKNVQGQLNLVLTNKQKHHDNPAFIQSAFQTVEHAAERIDRLLIQMRGRQQGMRMKPVAVAKVLKKVVQLTSYRKPVPSLNWRALQSEVIIMGNEDRLVNILCHLIENAQQATSDEGEVVLSVSAVDKKMILTIQDTGCGMDCHFLHTGLNKPFVTTKGDKGTGIGVYEAREYVHSVGGKLTVESIENIGSIFTLEFPLVHALQQQIVA